MVWNSLLVTTWTKKKGGGKGRLTSNFIPITPYISASIQQGFSHSGLSIGECRPKIGSVLGIIFIWLNVWEEEHKYVELCTSPTAPQLPEHWESTNACTLHTYSSKYGGTEVSPVRTDKLKKYRQSRIPKRPVDYICGCQLRNWEEMLCSAWSTHGRPRNNGMLDWATSDLKLAEREERVFMTY